MKYYQDFLATNDISKFIDTAISEFQATELYQTALVARQYDENRNVTIANLKKWLFDTSGAKYEDVFASNNKIATHVFNKLLTWTTQYSLAGGINYAQGVEVDEIIGKQIDTDTSKAMRMALRDGCVFSFYNGEKTTLFPVTEFVPLYDELTGQLMAGIRFFQIESDKPMSITLYEQDGFTQFVKADNKMTTVQEKRSYVLKIKGTQASGITDVEGENPSTLPIIKLNGNQYGISFLRFVRDKIDLYDIVLSGLANDIDENSFIYFILQNSGGMSDIDFAKVKQQLKTSKIASVDSDDGGKLDHFTKDIPHESRTVMLDRLMTEIYSAFNAVDMEKLSSQAVNQDQINIMYANADNQASELEYEVKGYVQALLAFKGIEIADYDIYFIRNKLQSELQTAQVNQINVASIMTASTELDDETLLETLKNNTDLFANIDVNKIITAKGEESLTVTEFENPIDNEQEIV